MDDEGLEVYATEWHWKFSFVQNFTLNVMNKLVQSNPVNENSEAAIKSICINRVFVLGKSCLLN